MNSRNILCRVALFAMMAGLAIGAASAHAATKAVISYASFNERTAGILLVAEDQGFFRKQDLDTRLIYMRTGSVAMSALASGESQFYIGSGTGTTLGGIAGGIDGVFVAGLVNRLTGAFVTSPQIKSPADLKGKNIGVQSIGGVCASSATKPCSHNRSPPTSLTQVIWATRSRPSPKSRD
jgi:NitT/TauT family transport system substrate-binding protein